MELYYDIRRLTVIRYFNAYFFIIHAQKKKK